MTFFKTAAIVFGLAILGVACGDSGNSNQPDVPILGGSGGAAGSHADGPVVPGTGGAIGAGGAVVLLDSGAGGAGGAVVVVDSGAGGSTGTVDANIVDLSTVTEAGRIEGGAGGAIGTIDGGTIDGGGGPFFDKPTHLLIINAATTSVGLTVTGPTPVLYTSCR
jgi:hypothetical protein